MTCQDVERLADAYADGELDLEQSLALEAHASGCATCSARLEAGQALKRSIRSAPYFAAPDDLRARLRKAASPFPAARPAGGSRQLMPWLVAAASLAIAIVGGSLLLQRLSVATADRTQAAVVDRHVASLMADHLMDVASSDRHTVKPWFAGRIEFSPPVPDLSADGFPLKGGRLDYVDGRTAVALVYTRGAHAINVFVWPSTDQVDTLPTTDSRGYHLVHWAGQGFTWWAVSDVAAADLQTFAAALAAASRR